MQAVRNAGSWLLRTWPPTTGVVARTPARTIHTGGRQLQDVTAKQKSERRRRLPDTRPHLDQPSGDLTQIQVFSASNQPLAHASCGTEGFRNARKGTGIAAQTAGIAAAAKAIQKGVTHIRVVVKGLGPGRLSAINGLTMGGLEVISITDNTPIPHNGCRPRKARRL
uniref:Mitochondrial ribosomal protein S11 n=1 Tax=Cebus imitator TaxID=2715852 RepID=A0A2K5RGL1_CEBIM